MITYIKSKIFWAMLKIEIYKALSHSDDYIDMFTKLAISAKDMKPEEVKSEFMQTLAGIVHDYAHAEDK